MILYLFRGILIGLLFGIPVGAVGALTVQRTLQYGVRAGLLTGLGSSAADCIYAGIGAFGLKLISDLLLRGQNIIHCGGGCLLLLMGISFMCRKTEKVKGTTEVAGLLQMFLSSFAIGITNPAAILTFLVAFSWMEVTGSLRISEGILLILGVFTGTYIWWGILSFVTEYLSRKAKNINMNKLNKIFGLMLTAIGGAILIEFLVQL